MMVEKVEQHQCGTDNCEYDTMKRGRQTKQNNTVQNEETFLDTCLHVTMTTVYLTCVVNVV